MISSNPDVPPSSQTDIVIYDEFHNSPLFRELAASVFPIEIVYAAIEVKRNLQSKDIKSCVEAIAQIRRLAKEKWYRRYGSQPVAGQEGRQVVSEEYQDPLAPRTFVVVYDTQFGSAESLRDAWTEELTTNLDGHLHGCVVLSKNWYFSQPAFQTPIAIISEEQNALVHFLSGLLTDTSSMNMALASMNRYFNIGYVSPPQDTDPQV